MTLQFVIGRSGFGKTSCCLQQMRDELERLPLGPPLIALVPEQASFQTEYALLQQPGINGLLRAQALSFRRLAFRVMQETGGTSYVPLSDMGKHMLLYKVMHKHAPYLQLFQQGMKQPGFLEKASELFTEWKRYGINSEAAQEAAQLFKEGTSRLLGSKLRDLALLYRELEQQMDGKYLDSEDYLHRLIEGFSSASSMNGAQIWVDGFHGFTPLEIEALRSILASANRVTVALTLDREYSIEEQCDELDLFYPAVQTYQAIASVAHELGIDRLPDINLNDSNEMSPRFEASSLAALEENFGRASITPYIGDISKNEAITLLAAPNRRDEIEAIAKDIVKKAKNNDARWRDCAVMLRNSEDYLDYIELIFSEYEIPYFIDQKEAALHHPLVEFIRSALETVQTGWEHDAIFRCIKTELLFPVDHSLPREWYDLLENHVLAYGIKGWKWQDEKYWRFAHETADATIDKISEARRSVVEILADFERKLKDSTTVTEMCEAVYLLLESASVAQRLEQWSSKQMEQGKVRMARSHRQLWNSVMNLLDQLVAICGEEEIGLELFGGMVEAGLDSLQLASVPPAIDQVLIGHMDRTRTSNIEYCYIAGANDGVMPMRMQEDGLISEPEREQLAANGLQLAPSIKRRLLDERFVLYNALTNARKHLMLSYAQADAEGKTLLSSEIIRQVKAIFPRMQLQTAAAMPLIELSEAEQLAQVIHPNRTMTYFITMLQQWNEGKAIADFWWEVYNWYAVRPHWRDRLQLLIQSLSFSQTELLITRETANELYGSSFKASVSRMERFVSCPFQHFLIHGLKLKERKQFRLEAPDVGQLFHDALSSIAERAGASWGNLSRSELEKLTEEIIDHLAQNLQSQILLSSGRFQYVTAKLKAVVTQTATVLGEYARRSRFKPLAAELDFGPNAELPALHVELPAGEKLEIIGRIDRVDAMETTEGMLLLVLDYKSSSTSLVLQRVAYGHSLQMLTYMNVLLTHGEKWLGKPVRPAGVLYFHVHNPIIRSNGRLTEEEAETQILKRFKSKGLITADAQIIRAMDNKLESGYSQILPVAVKKDDTLYSNSSAADDEQWQLLCRAVEGHIAQIGTAIKEGEIAVSPYISGTNTPCQYCSYKSVCQFDPLIAGYEYRKLPKQSKDEIWEQWRKEAAK